MSTILEHPKAQELLGQTTLDPEHLRPCQTHLTRFLQRYLPFFYRQEQRQHARVLLQGKLTGLDRKTTEPIAIQADLQRRPLQHFLGAGGWKDETVRAELHRHVQDVLGHPDAVMMLDPSGFPKKGDDSCGVARQWCGCLGKVENCQVGVFLGYSSPMGKTLLDACLYLPEERASDDTHRQKTFVPEDIRYQEKWRIALDLLKNTSPLLPHGWVTGDDEFGRVSEFRMRLRLAKERYVLDIPCNTLIRDLSERRPPSSPGGKPRVPAWERVDEWAARQPKKRWRKILVRDGEKGPLVVRVLHQWVQTKDEEGRVGPAERLVVIRSCEQNPRTWYTLNNALQEVSVEKVVRARGHHHGIEDLFQQGKGEVGLNHYEVRSWLGWAHHMTLTLLALWFLQLERLRLAEKKSPLVTVSQVRAIFSELLRSPRVSSREIARKVSAVLRRNEEARIYAWYKETGTYPPPRQQPHTPSDPDP